MKPGTWVLCPEKRRSGESSPIPRCAGVVFAVGPASRAAVEKRDGPGCMVVLRIDRTLVGYKPDDLTVLDDSNTDTCAQKPLEMPNFAHNVILAMGSLLAKERRETLRVKEELKRIVSSIKP